MKPRMWHPQDLSQAQVSRNDDIRLETEPLGFKVILIYISQEMEMFLKCFTSLLEGIGY